MGLVPGQKFERKVNKKNIDHYISLGYDVKLKDIIYVSPEHLSKGSTVKVKVKCSGET